jgi:hypothetical protein
VVIHLEGLLEARTVPTNWEGDEHQTRFLPDIEWKQHRGTLAAELNDRAWADVAFVYDIVESIAYRMRSRSAGTSVPDDELETILEIVRTAKRAMRSLGVTPAEAIAARHETS